MTEGRQAATDRPGTPSRVGAESERAASGESGDRRAAAGKAGAAEREGESIAGAAAPSSAADARPPALLTFAAPALPAAARRSLFPTTGSLAFRPETKSRVGLNAGRARHPQGGGAAP